MHYCKERHLFLFYNEAEAAQAAKSFPVTVGVHTAAKIPATKTTAEVSSLELVARRAKELEAQLGFTTTYLPSGHVFDIVQEVRYELHEDVYFLTQIRLVQGEIDAWAIQGATYEPYTEISAMGESMVVNGKIC